MEQRVEKVGTLFRPHLTAAHRRVGVVCGRTNSFWHALSSPSKRY
jgi:hypothetical protein